MRKLYILGAAAAVLAVSAATDSVAEPALVVDASGMCQTLDGNGDVVTTNNGTVVVTHSADGNINLRCKVDGVAPPPDGNAVRWDYANFGARCGFLTSLTGQTELTTRWWVQVSASGNSTIVCQYPDF